MGGDVTVSQCHITGIVELAETQLVHGSQQCALSQLSQSQLAGGKEERRKLADLHGSQQSERERS